MLLIRSPRRIGQLQSTAVAGAVEKLLRGGSRKPLSSGGFTVPCALGTRPGRICTPLQTTACRVLANWDRCCGRGLNSLGTSRVCQEMLTR